MIKFTDFSKSYGSAAVFKDFNMSVEEGKITSILGNSGTGKTTLLNSLCGLTDYQGKIEGVPQDIAYIFQNQLLLDNLTVYKNIEYVLKGRIKDKNRRKEIIDDILKAVELYDSRDKYPKELSTGMAQRVSMARAFVYPAPLILMDEPFRGLDIGLKMKLLSYFIGLWTREKRTVIFVTHSIDEALLLSDNIMVIGGKPANIIAKYAIKTPQNERNIADSELTNLYHDIFKLFSEN